MIFFPTGIKLSQLEYKCLLFLEADPEQWLLDVLSGKVRRRRDALIREWEPKFFADPKVAEFPTDDVDMSIFIMARSDYKSRLQTDTEALARSATNGGVASIKPPVPRLHNTERYRAKQRHNVVTLFPEGIVLDDIDCACLLAYIDDISDWILGALLGRISKGTKNLINKYHPIMAADSSVKNVTATEEGYITAIFSRSDYKDRSARDAAMVGLG